MTAQLRDSHLIVLRFVADSIVRLSQLSEPMRQRFIDLAMMEPPLVDADGDFLRLTAEGRAALSPDSPR